MEKEIAAQLKDILSRPRGEEILVEKRDALAVPFSASHFHAAIPSDTALWCVDGGQAILFETADLLIGHIRRAVVRAKGDATKLMSRDDAFVIIDTAVTANALSYQVRTIGSGESIKLDPNDAELRDGTVRAKLSRALEVVRKRHELGAALTALDAMGEGDVLALDGELDAKTKAEKAILDTLIGTAQGKGVAICGVAKSTTLLTKNGASLIGAISSMAPPGAWWYWPLIESKDVDWVISRLCSDAQGTYRIDIPAGDHPEPIISALSANAQDLSFPGYPYGLLVADQFARISEEEASARKAALMAGLSKEATRQGFDTHAMLNRILLRMNRDI